MYRTFTILGLFCVSFFYGQSKKSLERRPFIPVEVTKTDGTTEKILLRDIYFPKAESFMGIVLQSKNKSVFESEQLFEYKTSEASDIQKISYNDIKKVKVIDKYDDEIIGYEKLNIKKVSKDNQISDKNYTAILPILYDGKIDIYGYEYIVCGNGMGCMYAGTIMYIKNDKSDFAIMPVDVDEVSIFNMGSLDEKFINAFKYAGGDCPEFVKYLDDLYVKLQNRDFRKKMKQDLKENFQKAIDESKSLEKKDRFNYVTRKRSEYDVQMFVKMINEYEKNCP
ncbi:hypothetical protein CEY12_02190 [Chryseobacterium sp. T16E-39]|uniref:hypothetical protein n=1 Tax=Chryseobacterium sp. T16E-39 TaxID=2015076 RepID=UPI000B5B47A3|nr:hypothetical protein [Chryseobacterium sp. T16E-39]ASK28987.1 hypothetical protein CEY12_02190 [Chryseobacterium sp. T16E-39]